MQPDETAPHASEIPALVRPPRGVVHRAARRPIAILLGLLAAAAPWLLVAWLISTVSGLRFVAGALDAATRGQIRLEQPDGSLLHGVKAKRFAYDLDGIQIDAREVDLRWQLGGLLTGWLNASRVHARELTVTYAISPEPSGPFVSMALPIGLQLDDVVLGQFTLNERVAGEVQRIFGLRDARAAARLDHARWTINRVSGITDWGAASLNGTIGSEAPFALDAQGSLAAHYGAHAIDTRFTATGSLTEMMLDVQARSDALAGTARLGLRVFDPLPVVLVEAEGGTFDPKKFFPDAPSAALSFKVRLQPSLPQGGVPEAARLAAARIEGPVEVSNAAPGTLDSGRLPIERLAACLTFDASELIVKDLDLTAAGGGRVRGDIAWRPTDDAAADPEGRTEARLAIKALDLARIHSALPVLSVGGELVAKPDRDRQRVEGRLGDGRVVADLVASYRRGNVGVDRVELISGPMRLKAAGSLDMAGGRAFKLEAEAQSVDPSALWKPAPRGKLTGTMAASGKLVPRLVLDARLALADSTLAGMPLAGGGTLMLDGARVRAADIKLNALGNQLAAQGAFGVKGDRLTLRVDAPHLEHLGQGFSGRLVARGNLGGTIEQPAGAIDLAASQLALPDVVRADAINLRGRLNEGRDGAMDVRLTVAGVRSMQGADQYVRRGAMTLLGTRAQHKLTMELDFPKARSASLTARGGLSERLDWSGMIEAMMIDWDAELNLTEPVALSFGPDHLQLASTRLQGERAAIVLEQTSWRPDELIAKGSMTGMRLGLSLNDAQQVVARGDSLQMGAEWDLALKQTVNGQIRVFREAGDLVLDGDAPVALGLTEFEAIIAATDDRVALAASAAGKRIGVISASATAQTRRHGHGWRLARSEPLLGRARIEVPSVSWLGPVVDPNLRTEGSIQGDFSLSGTPDQPIASGEIVGEGLGVLLVEQGLRLSGGSLVARFDADRFRLERLSFVSPSRVRPNERRIDYANLAAQPGLAGVVGDIDLATGKGQFQVTAERLPILQQPNLWLMLSGEAEVVTTWDSVAIKGRLAAPAGYVGLTSNRAPQLDEDVVVRGRSVPQERPFRIDVDLAADLGRSLYLHAYGVDTRLAGEIHLRGRPGEPFRASGQIETRDGQYDAYGQRLSIEEGLITFQGPLDNPTLAITALRKGLQVEAGVAISGSAQRPKVRLVSDPNVPDAEKLSWIILGRGPAGSSEGDGALLIAAASALLGDQTGGLTNQVARTFGVDQITLAQSDNRGLGNAAVSQVAGSATGFSSSSAAAASDSVPGQVLLIGKRLTQNINLSFEQSLSGGETLVKLSYALTRTLSLVARAGTDNALDLQYNISFR
ncbi:translocation/assembly module TamB domain-containing protein [Niveibacterium sp. 24ML]|uniref:translocation/assembly module TamB domain-containing protein n=1 Tax=Niveibacterium sp. 24ML TaxID=2985512 RepID=UPI002270C606|nr:translocation/assembly module TamB domain-containing protein [Niveibacterium sp. 24ML]MCX9158232.1 translocation/assembly module TamB domain-containing protein [Niveibacterium sp. 24ML]